MTNSSNHSMDAGAIAAMIDHTLLKPESTRADIKALCDEARLHNFASVCVNPTFVRDARENLAGCDVAVCTVVGFPLGAHVSDIKVEEARIAIEDGATEIDMVQNVGALKAGDAAYVEQDIAAVVEVCKSAGAICKVILETCLLNDKEKVMACKAAIAAGADFVKTSTGFSKGGATAEDVKLMHDTVKDAGLSVKASGGVRTLADFTTMVAAGASRIGASAGIAIIQEASGGGGPAAAGDY